MHPKISIITPALIDSNDKIQWLNECVLSVINQSFEEWEMLIMNDSSPIQIRDGIPPDDRIRIIDMVEKNGPSLCRNTAVALARSKAILPLDADDFLADNQILEKMYDLWVANPDKIIYGDLQRFERVKGGQEFQRTKYYSLPEYDFSLVKDLRGIIPVTALHSKECHIAAGGWKPDLDHGYEDIEYWIACGKAGFCGKKLNELVFYYRKHDDSRSNNLTKNKQESSMRSKITDMHDDVFKKGKYPMGCCGDSNTSNFPPPAPKHQASVPQSDLLDKYSPGEIMWLVYNGGRRGRFGMVGKATGISYTVHGTGFVFPIHKTDSPIFLRSGRGLDFSETQPPDNVVHKEPVTEIPKYEPPKPPVGSIRRPDKHSLDKTITIATVKSEFAPPDEIAEIQSLPTFTSLTELEGISNTLIELLSSESWSIESLSIAKIEDLQVYPGIGETRARSLINKAKDYVKDNLT